MPRISAGVRDRRADGDVAGQAAGHGHPDVVAQAAGIVQGARVVMVKGTPASWRMAGVRHTMSTGSSSRTGRWSTAPRITLTPLCLRKGAIL